jgi:CRISPR-associated protein Cas2
MNKRALYLIAYDIRHPRRLRKVLRVVKAYTTGGQKSVHECFLSATEKAELKRALAKIIHGQTDSVVFVRLDPRATPRTLGIAVPPRDEAFFYVG